MVFSPGCGVSIIRIAENDTFHKYGGNATRDQDKIIFSCLAVYM